MEFLNVRAMSDECRINIERGFRNDNAIFDNNFHAALNSGSP